MSQYGHGERMLIIAARGAGRTNFFSALAGLWPWGSGRIARPMGQTMMFMSQRPYLPHGTLRAALAYPAPVRHSPKARSPRRWSA